MPFLNFGEPTFCNSGEGGIGARGLLCIYGLACIGSFYPPLDEKLPVFTCRQPFFTKFYYHNLHCYHVFHWLHTATVLGGQTFWTPGVVETRYDSLYDAAGESKLVV